MDECDVDADVVADGKLTEGGHQTTNLVTMSLF